MNLFIAVPFFNQAHYLKDTLFSVLAQTDPDWKLVVFDDSIDRNEAVAAMSIIKELRDPRIEYHRNSVNLGMAKNWNQGLERGRHFLGVCILHADDCLLPNYVEKMRAAFQKYPNIAAFFCQTEIINAQGKRSFSFPDWYKRFLIPGGSEFRVEGMEGIRSLIRGNYIFCPSLCFRPDSIQDERFDEKYKMVLDLDFILRLLKQGKVLMGLYEKPLYQYRRHSRNATSQMTANLVRFDEEEKLLKPYLHQKRALIISLHLGYLCFRSLLSFNFNLAFRFAKKLLVRE